MLAALRTWTVSTSALDWFCSYARALARRDATAVTGHMHEACVYQLNNHLPFFGRETIGQALLRYWERFEDLRHEPLNIYGTDNAFCVEMLSHYRLKDGRLFTIPAAQFIDRNDAGLMISGRAHIDLAPVFETQARA